MANTFYTWEQFTENFGREMREACELFEQMSNNGCPEGALAQFDFTFESDKADKLLAIKESLLERVGYSVTSVEVDESEDDCYELNGSAAPFPVTEDNVMYWVLDMAKLGYQFDAKLTGYGAEVDEAALPIDISAHTDDEFFEMGMTAYESGDRSAAQFNWALAIAVNPENADAYYSRAIVKHELHTWKAALRDYDEAIRLDPTHLQALLNRGSVKDENEDPTGAIADYNKVIELSGNDKEQMALAYFNRGNTKFRQGDKAEACVDWKKARGLGADYAEERIAAYCG